MCSRRASWCASLWRTVAKAPWPCFQEVCGGELVTVRVQGPFGQSMEASYLQLEEKQARDRNGGLRWPSFGQ